MDVRFLLFLPIRFMLLSIKIESKYRTEEVYEVYDQHQQKKGCN